MSATKVGEMFNCLKVASLHCDVQVLVKVARLRIGHDLVLRGTDGHTEVITCC